MGKGDWAIVAVIVGGTIAAALAVGIGITHLIDKTEAQNRERFVACTAAGTDPGLCFDLIMRYRPRVDGVWEKDNARR